MIVFQESEEGSEAEELERRLRERALKSMKKGRQVSEHSDSSK